MVYYSYTQNGWEPMESVKALEKEIADAGTEIKVIIYPGTVHGTGMAIADRMPDDLAKKYGMGIRNH